MAHKQRLICPVCSDGFIIYPRVEKKEIKYILGDAPHCAKCGERYEIKINTEKLEICIRQLYK